MLCFEVSCLGFFKETMKFSKCSTLTCLKSVGSDEIRPKPLEEIRQKLQNYKIDWNHRIFSLEPQAYDGRANGIL